MSDLLPPPGVVDVWWLANGSVGEEWLAVLDEGERERHAAYLREADRSRFRAGAVTVRRLYAADLGVAPVAVRIDRSCPDCDRPHGRVRALGSTLDVSVSHSGDWVLVAAARARPVGVDVERVDARVDVDGVSRLTMTPAEIATLPAADRAGAFTALWVRKEAVVKATGDGLRTPLADLSTDGTRVVSWAAHPELVRRIQIHDLPCDPEHRAALAVLGADPVIVRVRRSIGMDLT